MDIFKKPIQAHINNLSGIYDRFLPDLYPQEKESLNAAMEVLDELERNSGVLILKQN